MTNCGPLKALLLQEWAKRDRFVVDTRYLILSVITLEDLRWAGHVEGMESTRYSYKMFVQKFYAKKSPDRSRPCKRGQY